MDALISQCLVASVYCVLGDDGAGARVLIPFVFKKEKKWCFFKNSHYSCNQDSIRTDYFVKMRCTRRYMYGACRLSTPQSTREQTHELQLGSAGCVKCIMYREQIQVPGFVCTDSGACTSTETSPVGWKNLWTYQYKLSLNYFTCDTGYTCRLSCEALLYIIMNWICEHITLVCEVQRLWYKLLSVIYMCLPVLHIMLCIDSH